MLQAALSAPRFDALADARTQLNVTIAQALVRISQADQSQAKARKPREALARAIDVVRGGRTPHAPAVGSGPAAVARWPELFLAAGSKLRNLPSPFHRSVVAQDRGRVRRVSPF